MPRRTPLNNFTDPKEERNPVLSIVIVPLIGEDVLAKCLDRLPLDEVECIVVLRLAMGTAASWERRYRTVKFLDATDEPVPVRRQFGVETATGDIVALIEDTSWPDEGWCTAVRAAFEDPETAAAGGAVRIADSLPNRYQALGWSEYGAFAPLPLQTCSAGSQSPATRVPGNNLAFRRADLIEALRGQNNGLFEGSVCQRLLARGRRVVWQKNMSVTYAACDAHNASLATRLHHGRIYAATRFSDQGWPAKLGHLIKTPFLPVVLTASRVSYVARSGRLMARLPVIFWIFLMESFWALGEAIGALAGVGTSMREWR